MGKSEKLQKQTSEFGKDKLIVEKDWTVIIFKYLDHITGRVCTGQHAFGRTMISPKEALNELVKENPDFSGFDYKNHRTAISFNTHREKSKTFQIEGEQVEFKSLSYFSQSKEQFINARLITLEEAGSHQNRLTDCMDKNPSSKEFFEGILRHNEEQVYEVVDGKQSQILKCRTRIPILYAFDSKKHEIITLELPVIDKLKNENPDPDRQQKEDDVILERIEKQRQEKYSIENR